MRCKNQNNLETERQGDVKVRCAQEMQNCPGIWHASQSTEMVTFAYINSSHVISACL